MAFHTPTARLLMPLIQSFRSLTTALVATPQSSLLKNASRSFSSTPATMAKKSSSRSQKDLRIGLIRYHLQHPKTPRPLRLSRLRALRHWTIHRAWMLARRKRIAEEQMELQRMYQSMQNACEELRLLDSPGTKDAGRLYRVAMEKKGIFGHGGIPIEYARLQTETPPHEAWSHDWTR